VIVDRPRVLLLWPGGLFAGGANFGVPQLLSIAGVLRRAGAEVDVVDLDMERAFGGASVPALCRAGYDLVGIGCYSSYDYLKVMAIAELVRAELPRAWLVTGGYHPSARPGDFTGDGSPFDYVVVGDGEAPMLRLLQALEAGRRPLVRVIGPEALPDRNLVTYDWELLERYRPVARRVASQAEIYLSRGCPYDCAFCMERAKRDTAWRALDPERAVEEVHRLDRFLDLSSWTLFVADALFGMKAPWRKTFLEALARRPSRAQKIWLLIRVDLVDREDLELMARANVAPGFGLESGDPEHLRRIRKSGKLEGYLDRMRRVAGWAHELGVPFGANVIVGHPGETEASMRTSAAYLRELFLGDARGTMGFLSVDPFRLYPGSPIDDELDDWRRDTGMRLHRYPWWHDGDQDFLSEWVDPSSELDFRRTFELRRELFDPIVRAIPRRFSYQGPARDYFVRAIDEQVELASPRRHLHTLGLWHLWRELTGNDRGPTLEEDADLATVARAARHDVVENMAYGAALEAVPRERFVDVDQIGRSADDAPSPLGDDERATISAFHAYARAFEALELGAGDALVELGGGSGYGAAVAAEIVGERGSVLSIEIDPDLAERAMKQLSPWPWARCIAADAHDTTPWAGATKVYVAFALRELPQAWLDALAPGGRLIAPIGRDVQVLTVFDRQGARELEPVRYVPDRSPSHRGDASRRSVELDHVTSK
jgi:protein-L-isoaspartate(D-aspartate) O-methyltransferase